MYRNKKDVDKHVDSLLSKLHVKEFKSRAYSIARLYYDIGDFSSCQKYVEQYLTFKDNNAAAHKLLGQALQKLGHKETALEHFTTSRELDPSQTSIIPEICELLLDDTNMDMDVSRLKYWCEKAQSTFPRHPATFRLRERLVSVSDNNPAAVTQLLTSELSMRPKDAIIHSRLIKHYLNTNQAKQAFEHCCNVEFNDNPFMSNYAWYETLSEILKHSTHSNNDWLYQLLLLTVRGQMCNLSLIEISSVSSKTLVESNELLHSYDQAIETVAKAGPPPGFAEFHSNILLHHKGQLSFFAATFLLKKAKKNQLSWKDAVKFASPLFLIAFQTAPIDIKGNWLSHAPEKQKIMAKRWYFEGSYRCSQSGHYLITNNKDCNQSFADKISQCCSGPHWRDTLFKRIFTNKEHVAKIEASYLASTAFNAPVLRLPRKVEVEDYDVNAQREYPNSLHHFVWTLQNYKNYGQFKCVLFDMLKPASANCGPESLNKLDVEAFLYSSAISALQSRQTNDSIDRMLEKPKILPANITDLLCSPSQMKWWDITYKYVQNELGSELTDVRTTLSRGIEVIRCMDNHGLDPELLCMLGRIFGEKAKNTTSVEEKRYLELRAGLYYNAAIPYLEKLKNKVYIKVPEKRLFEYTHIALNPKELNALLDEATFYVAVNHFHNLEFEKVIELIAHINTPQAYYYIGESYRKLSLDELNSLPENISSIEKSKLRSLLSKAKTYAYKALNKLSEDEKDGKMISDVRELIDNIETELNKVDCDNSMNNTHDSKNSSDENFISGESAPLRNNHTIFRNLSSTPKHTNNCNMTKFRTAADSQILEGNQIDNLCLERIESQIKDLQRRDSTITEFMDQSRTWFEENRKLGTQIISTMHTNMQHTTDQFKLLKISIDHIKDQLVECKSECKDVSDLKKQIAELKKEVNKLKKVSSEQTIDDSDLYNLEDEYRSSESNMNLPYNPPPVIPPFNQRLLPTFPLPPNPYQLYSQNMYNLYNQYSQFAQPQVPGPPPVFDPTRTPVNYPGMYPNPDQMYLDIAHLVPPTIQPPTSIPVLTNIPPPVPNLPVVPTPAIPTVMPATVQVTKPITSLESKEIPRSLPVNVVITSSDPLPTGIVTTPAPILSVTIPPKHIKNTPHNYQIQMPSTSETKGISSPIFSFPRSGNTTGSSTVNWNPANLFKTNVSDSPQLNESKTGGIFEKSVVDGMISLNNSLNKSRTISEKSNTSVENYDPCPDFKPIVPLPDEIKVTTGEEDEIVIFSARAKLFRFTNKEWKERGLGEMKLLKHKVTGKVRVLMRREQVHKICANHIITPEMEINPMPNETKAYIWVANDFADETVVLEKFCVRFKMADTARKFYEEFEKSRKELSIVDKPTNKKSELPISVTNTNIMQPSKPMFGGFKFNTKPENEASSIPSNLTTQDNKQTNKSVVGGFTFSSAPVFKPVIDSKTESTPQSETNSSNKLNIFSGLSLKTNSTTSSPFNNIFSNSSIKETNVQTQPKPTISEKLNNSDTVEEFEPTADFTPVIPLPALVDQKTGEEDEIILFEHRAQLLRFDTATKEWKERGLGNMKLLVHKDNAQKIRLLMRREQIMKVCCNHAVTKELIFKKMPNVEKAVTWCAKDFSEGELVTETFCLRFRNAQLCNEFMQAVESAQSKLKDETKVEQNVAKQSSQTGFGDTFKPKPGSWHCETCYTNNLENFSKCACCEQPRPTTKGGVEDTSKSGWGDKFKPKAGSWECNQCLIRNEANNEVCSACNSPRDPTKTTAQATSVDAGAPKFNFGIPSQSSIGIRNVSPATTASPATTVAGWGDKFKPKEGSWECKQCLIRNESSLDKCGACASVRDPTVIISKNLLNTSETQSLTFKFGIPPPSSDQDKNQITTPASIFDGTGAYKFSFGIPKTDEDKVVNVPFTGAIFAAPKAPTKTDSPINFSMPKSDVVKAEEVKPVLLSKLQEDSQSKPFEFVFKPKTPPKSKSPRKTPKSPEADDSDGNEYASEDEGHHLHFSPVVPLPDKVAVVTGEENENELYAHRAKLFIFTSGEWKERGIGVVKVLKHKENGKIRVVMRREQVFKICLNHALTPDINYTPKDEKTWLFAANDFSEGELNLQQFCLRFKSKEIALQFKNAVDNAKGSGNGNSPAANKTAESDSDEVVFVSETLASAEEKQKAKDLMLPENFFMYKEKDPCQGCRGCTDEDDVKPTSAISAKHTKSITAAISTPAKTALSKFSSQINTPLGSEMGDISIYRTPLGSIGSNSKSTPTNSSPSNSIIDSTDKENSSAKTNVFALPKIQPVFDSPHSKPNNIFGNATQSVSSKGSLIAAPKLGMNSTTEEKQNLDPKAVFGAAQQQNVIGGSIFGNAKSETFNSVFAAENKTEPKAEVKSIFGDGQKSVNLFSGSTPGSLFGPSAMNNKPVTGSLFGASNNSLFGSAVPETQPKKEMFGKTNQNSIWNTTANDIQRTETKNETFFSNIPSNLSFDALCTAGPGFGEKKEDFKWEGAGQQLFSGKKRTEQSNNESNADDSVEGAQESEYDPYYEPIVPLPEKIEVTTGEEEEQRLFCERCKLFRYDEKQREWKERGVGDMKILHHPGRNSYRLLLRREQVHKAVLNMLLFMDLELLPMKNSDRAWTWAGMNYAEVSAGEHETLAVRFKSIQLAVSFHDKVVECVRKLQAAAAKALREKDEVDNSNAVAPLRLPKHLEDSARADVVKQSSPTLSSFVVKPNAEDKTSQGPNTPQSADSTPFEASRQVHFEENEEAQGEDEDYDHYYDHEDYEGYYNEEEEATALYAADGEVIVEQGDTQTSCATAHIQVVLDQDVYSPKIFITDSTTEEILADMLIQGDTEFQMSGDSCTWSGIDYTTNDPTEKTVTINFPDGDAAMQFYDTCETNKANAIFTSTDQE